MTAPRESRLPVTVLTTSFPRFPGDIAGHFVRSACIAVATHGYALTVVTPHAPDAPTKENDEGLAVRRFRYAVPASAQRLQWSSLQTDWIARATAPSYVAAFSLAARRHARGAALLHAHWIPSALVARAAMVGQRPVPVVVSVWGSDALLLGRGRLGRQLLSALQRAAAVTVVSRKMKDDLAAAGVADGRLHIVPSAVEQPRMPGGEAADVRGSLALPPGRPVLLYLGRLSEEKGPDVLLAALATLAPAQRPLVVFVGDGPLRSSLEAQSRDQGLADATRFEGFVPHGEIGSWLRAADALVLPSRSEGLPHAALEAMAAGVPVVASAVGGLPDVIRNGENGWLVPSEDPTALAAALRAVTADRERSRRIGATARIDAERDYVGYGRMGRQLAAIYSSLL